ncbi:hypothetical protein HS7_17100 [Sulfolobales archaeon HS-7]|nr:hypothetical protein HS7_17100 [Sulfolobales archaeon HS-7]
MHNYLIVSDLSNEAKKLASAHARTFRNVEKALYGNDVSILSIYKKVKECKDKAQLSNVLNTNNYDITDAKLKDDLKRFFSDIIKSTSALSDRDALFFANEAFTYLIIALQTKLDAMKRGYWY